MAQFAVAESDKYEVQSGMTFALLAYTVFLPCMPLMHRTPINPLARGFLIPSLPGRMVLARVCESCVNPRGSLGTYLRNLLAKSSMTKGKKQKQGNKKLAGK